MSYRHRDSWGGGKQPPRANTVMLFRDLSTSETADDIFGD
jgi:hypothetical protein